MPDSDDKVGESLSQIKADIEKGLDGIAGIKQTADAELLPELDKIEQDGWTLLINLDEIDKKRKKDFAASAGKVYSMDRPMTARKSEKSGLKFFCL